MNYKDTLHKIIVAESQKSKKKAMISAQVYQNFSKLAYASNTEKNAALVQEAVSQYNKAVHTNTKMSRFNTTKIHSGMKNENLKFLGNNMDEPDERKQKASKQGYFKTIDEFKNKISKEDKTDFTRASKASAKFLKENLIETKKHMSIFKFDSFMTIHFSKDELVLKNNEVVSEKAFQHTYITVYQASKVSTESDIEDAFKNYLSKAEEKFNYIILRGSGWKVDTVSYQITKIYKNKNLTGSGYVKTPEEIDNKRNGLVNIKNEDNECFKWCMKFHQSENQLDKASRLTALKKIDDKYNYENINYPVGMEDINTFECNNSVVKINVFMYDNNKKEIQLLRRSNSKGTDLINLLLINDDTNEHYTYIKNMSNLFKANKNRGGKVFCEKCFVAYTEKQMKTHKCDIVSSEDFKTVITYPDQNEVMEMSIDKYKKQLKAPFICYCDFESFVIPTNDKSNIQKHVVNSYCIKLVCSFDNKYNDLFIFRGDNVVEHFLEKLLKLKDETDKISKALRTKYKDHNLSKEEEKDFKTKKECYICCKKSEQLVRDHCHFTGKYRGAACNACNINFHNMKVSKEGKDYVAKTDLICAFHNLRGYDGHFIIQASSKYTTNVRAISQSFEKFMTFSFLGLKFIDTFLFMSSGLETLADSLKSNGEDKFENFIYTKDYFKNDTELMCRKGVYPYEYTTDKSVFELGFPSKKHFYSTLKNENIKDEEYEYALKVYAEMKCENFGDYHDKYLVCDVLLLADIFENFRKSALEKYKLDPANYLTAPSMAWDAMLDMTKIKLGLIHDEETRLLFENNKRGGIVQAGAKRLVQANNKYMKNYDETKESNFISYLDMNNQYGAAMRDYLPYELGGFKEMSLEDILKHPREAENGYFVECDIHLPQELHDKFKDYPLCPITRNVNTSELSNYQKDILQQNNSSHSNSSKKLILDFHDKTNYLCHYRYIQGIVKLGYQITKIHKVIEFKQSQWLMPYIDMNTTYRQQKGISKFLKDFYKLLNNSIYGKTNENVLGRTAIELEKNDVIAIKKMSKENFRSGVLLDDMFFIESNANTVHYNRPSYIGNAILDLSKLYMFEFHYNYMKKKYGDKCELIYTDTDSFVYDIKCDDLYKDNFDDRDEYFDLSEVAIEKFKDEKNAKVIGKMKDESNFIPITEFCSLAPKSYSFKTDLDEIKKTCKGVSRAVLKKEISHDDYKNTLKTNEKVLKINTSIRSFKHQVFTYQCVKVCLSSFDDKVYRESFNVGYPYGHYKIN